jgi:hypothetical protein
MPDTQIRLTRDQLAEFLPNSRAIKAFEQLMLMTGSVLPNDVTILQQLVQEVSIESGSNSAKSDLALALLAEIEANLALLTLAPNNTNGEFSIPFGTTAQYWRGDKTWRDFMPDVLATTLTGLSTATNAVITAADTVLTGLGKLQAQITGILAGKLSQFAPTTSSELAGVITDETGSGSLVFGTSPTLTTPKATTTIGVGNTTASASGAGISFPATQSASTDANTLDDYAEGTWTPTVVATTGTITAYTSSGRYTKIGDVVSCSFTFTVSNNGTGSGFIRISLPFTAASTQSVGSTRESAVTGNMGQVFSEASVSTAFVTRYDNAYPVASGYTIIGSLTYNV